MLMELTRQQKFRLAMVGIILTVCAITAIEIVALLNGIDGQVLSGGIAALAATGGWFARSIRTKE